MSTNDANWVEDVRRWYFNGGKASAAVKAPEVEPHSAATPLAELGYEAAHPSLQSPHWPTPARTQFGSLR